MPPPRRSLKSEREERVREQPSRVRMCSGSRCRTSHNVDRTVHDGLTHGATERTPADVSSTQGVNWTCQTLNVQSVAFRLGPRQLATHQ